MIYYRRGIKKFEGGCRSLHRRDWTTRGDWYRTDEPQYNLPVSSFTDVVNFSGKISKIGFKDSKISVTVIKPNSTKQLLSTRLDSAGFFRMGLSLNKDSKTDSYKAKAKYLKVESNEIIFQVKQNPQCS